MSSDPKMKLHWSPRSPFVRKVMIVLHETGQLDSVDCVRSLVAMPLPPNPAVLADNPLGKIPTLVTPDGIALFDSRVICEYLDMRVDGGLLPAKPEARITQLRWQALGDGMTENLLLWRTELTRPSGAWAAVVDGWQVKTRAALAQLEAEVDALSDTPFGLGQIAIICGLGQLDFRWPDCNWRSHHPRLAALYEVWQDRPSVQLTQVTDDQDSDNSVTEGQLVLDPA